MEVELTVNISHFVDSVRRKQVIILGNLRVESADDLEKVQERFGEIGRNDPLAKSTGEPEMTTPFQQRSQSFPSLFQPVLSPVAASNTPS